MRVLHVIPSVSKKAGGPSQAIFPMCRALQRLGIEVTLVTTDHGMHPERGGSDKTIVNGISTRFFHTNWGDSFKYSREFATWLDKNVSRFDLVHIHAVFNHSCIAAARACRKHHIPYIVEPLGSLDPWGMSQKRFRKWIFWQIAGKAMCRGSSAMHYAAIQEKRGSEEHLKLNHGRVIPLGIEEVGTSPTAEKNPAIQTPYILVLSRIVPTKGIDVLLRAFLSLAANPTFPKWSLVIAGDGPVDYVNKLKHIARITQPGNSVVFTGWLDGELKQQMLSHASLLALTSHHENFGVCVMEALACGVPVLISPQVGLSDEVTTKDAGWVVPVDHTSIVTALTEALGNDALRAKKGIAGQELSRKFSWEIVGGQMHDLYNSILNTSNHCTA